MGPKTNENTGAQFEEEVDRLFDREETQEENEEEEPASQR
jgi:hypothetical protein